MKAIRLVSMGLAGVLAGSVVLAETPSGKETREEFHEKMAAQMKEQDAELDKLEQQINGATTEQQKVDALTAAVTTLINQRKAMHSQLQAIRERIQEQRSERHQNKMSQPPPSPTAP